MTTEVHPAAQLFPMLPDDELRALADDIKRNGLIHALVRDPDGLLLDGRNRLAACALAGVDPVYVEHDGDPYEFVISANINRRHLTAGQRAFLARKFIARRALGTNQYTQQVEGRPVGQPSRDEAAKRFGSSGGAIGRADVIAKEAPELVAEVEAGKVSLDAAYNKAIRVRDAKMRKAAPIAPSQPSNEPTKRWVDPHPHIARAPTVEDENFNAFLREDGIDLPTQEMNDLMAFASLSDEERDAMLDFETTDVVELMAEYRRRISEGMRLWKQSQAEYRRGICVAVRANAQGADALIAEGLHCIAMEQESEGADIHAGYGLAFVSAWSFFIETDAKEAVATRTNPSATEYQAGDYTKSEHCRLGQHGHGGLTA